MRVALFTETFLPKVDGIVTVVCLLLDHLAERGVESVIVAPSLSPRLGHQVSKYANTHVIRTPGITLPIYPELKFGPPTLVTYRQLKQFNPQVAHFIHPVVIGSMGLLMMKRMGVPILTSFHLDMAGMAQQFGYGIITPAINWMTRTLFNAAHTSLAPSRQVQRNMQALGIHDVGLWRRGVDAERFNPCHRSDTMREALSDGHTDDHLLIYVGRLSIEKQIDQLRPILEQVPNTRLAIIGDGPAREMLERHFAGTPTKFMGYMTGEALWQAYASADVFVFPSAMESFGLVVVEAMAAGLPVVASRVGGIPDVVEEGETGYTFAVGDTASLVNGVRKIVTNPDTLRQMGMNARAFAETQTWPAMMDEVIDIYAHLIDHYPTAHRD